MKKLDPDTHVGPVLTLFLLFFAVVAIGYFEPLILVAAGIVVVILTFPLWFTYLWNKYIATEDEYYD